MLFSNITVLNEEYKAVGGKYVAIDGGRIVYVGDDRPEGDFGREIDGRGRLLMSWLF